MHETSVIQASFIIISHETDDDSTTTQANNLQIRLTYDIVYIDFAKWCRLLQANKRYLFYGYNLEYVLFKYKF